MKAEWGKDSVESMAYKDMYSFHNRFGVPEKSDRYWTALVDAAAEINAKYKDTKMSGIVSKHLIGVMTLLDKEVRDETG